MYNKMNFKHFIFSWLQNFAVFWMLYACKPWGGRDLYHPMAHSPHPDTRRISFTHVPMASVWVVALHSLFLYLDLPPPRHPPDGLRPFSSQTFSRTNTPTFSTPVILHTYPPMKMEQTVCSETLAYKIQLPGNYPEESIQHFIVNFFITFLPP